MPFTAPTKSEPLLVEVRIAPKTKCAELFKSLLADSVHLLDAIRPVKNPTESEWGLALFACRSREGAVALTTTLKNALGADCVRHLEVLSVVVTVEGMQFNQSDSDLRTALEAYGTVTSDFTRTTIGGLPSLTRQVSITLREPIPRALLVGNFECRATYPGQPPTCARCGKLHTFVQCPSFPASGAGLAASSQRMPEILQVL